MPSEQAIEYMEGEMQLFKSSVVLLLGLSLIACSAGPLPEAQEQLARALDSGRVQQHDGFYEFLPADAATPQKSCFIFYPGGLVSADAYVPYVQRISEAGYPSYLLQLPLNLAVISMGAADKVKSNADIAKRCEHYVVGGHSLGGVAAANYMLSNADDGLLLLAAYPQESKPITDHRGPAVSVYASNDGLTTQADIEASKATMPATTRWVEVVGGNHAHFGWYGVQDGDGESAITREQQQQLVHSTTLELLAEMGSTE